MKHLFFRADGAWDETVCGLIVMPHRTVIENKEVSCPRCKPTWGNRDRWPKSKNISQNDLT